MIEVLNSYLCHDCGSDHAISEVVYGKIKINLCKECIDKKEDQTEFKFSELSDKAKARAIYFYLLYFDEDTFEEAWQCHLDSESEWLFDEDGELLE